MAGDDDTGPAVGQRAAVLAVEPAQVGEIPLGVRGVGVGVAGVGRGERLGDRTDHGDHPAGIEPDVRVDVAGEHLTVDLALGAGQLRVDAEQFHRVEEVDGRQRVGCLGDRGLDLWLESPAEEDRDIGRLEHPELSGLEFEVVRPLAGRRQRGDRHQVAAHAAGSLLERVEGGDHAQGRSVGALTRGVVSLVAAARCEEEARRRESDEREADESSGHARILTGIGMIHILLE